MDNTFSRIEARIQRFIEEGTARLFSSQDDRGKLAASLIEAMQAEVQFGEGDSLVAPSVYTILANPEQASSLKASAGVLEEIKGAMFRAAAQSGIQIPNDIVFHIVPEESINDGDFRVRCNEVEKNIGQTQSIRRVSEPAEHQCPSGAFLIVGGTEIFTLNAPIVNIGRKNDNQLVIENPQVSRRHAQLRAISGNYHFFDLGSTGGSKVNNQDVKTAVLMAGDVITLSGVPLIYGQDAVQPAWQTQEFHPGKNGAAESA